MSGRTSRVSWSGSRWGRWLWACSIFALLVLTLPVRASGLTLLEQSLKEADENLTALEALWPKLSVRLNESVAQLEQAQRQLCLLQGALTLWRQNSDEWEKASRDSLSALATVQTSLDGLTKRYDALLASWLAYRKEVERQAEARELVVKRWRTVAMWGIVGALAGGFLVGVFAGK